MVMTDQNLELTTLADEAIKDIVQSVFNQPNPNLIHCFTNPDFRTSLETPNIVWKDSKSRFPHINRFTGTVAYYTNVNMYTFAFTKLPRLQKAYEKAKLIEPNEPGSTSNSSLTLTHGPPALLIKPNSSGKSSPYVYRFQDVQPGLKFTAIVCLSEHNEHKTGEMEILVEFDKYYDILSDYYNFDDHMKTEDILYLEKWFVLQEANEVIEEYLSLYNYYQRQLPSNLNRKVRSKVVNLYQKRLQDINNDPHSVPQNFIPMKWKKFRSQLGDVIILSSKQAIRTVANISFSPRIYLQIPAEPRPADWENSLSQISLRNSYKDGKFGDWMKPGLRKYLRENSNEHEFKSKTGTLESFTQHEWSATELQILGIS